MTSMPPELFSEILPHCSITDLKTCSLVNLFFQKLAQAALFSHIRIQGELGERVAFFGTKEGHRLLQYTKALELGKEFLLAEDDSLVAPFFRGLMGSEITSLRLVGTVWWHNVPEDVLNGLYTVVMPHLRCITFDYIAQIPFLEILARCPLLRQIELDKFTTAPSRPTDAAQRLPSIHSLIINYWGESDLEHTTSLAAYLQGWGSAIESLSLEQYKIQKNPFSLDLFPTLKPPLRHLSFGSKMLVQLMTGDTMKLKDLLRLESLRLSVNLESTDWTSFLHFVYRHLEPGNLPPPFRNIHVLAFGWDGRSLCPVEVDSEPLGGSWETNDFVDLVTKSRVHLHITLGISPKEFAVAGDDGPSISGLQGNYWLLKREVEPTLRCWMQAGKLTMWCRDIS
ncbi:hypothetical protein DL96DRAFT_1710951 [Flagelloscypha sp. PMI_526]|nr:hypothetical protein DL96DRAFT_1710951 [Flagelloscypha sp. PMI_526]